MSKIQDELVKITGAKPKDGESRTDYLIRLLKESSAMSDKDFDGLTDAAADWVNAAQDARNAKKDLPEMPDYTPPAETSGRRRRSSEDDDAGDSKIAKVKEGDEVVIKTKRGAVKTGKVIEVNDKMIAIDDGKEEIEFDFDRLEAVTKANNGKEEEPEGNSRRRRSSEDDEPQGPKDPAVGDQVTAVTARGTTIKGKVIEIDDKIIVIDDGKEEREFDKDRLTSVTVEGGSDEGSSRRRRSSGDDKASDKEEGTRTRSSNRGKSIGERIKELIVDNMDASVEEIGKMLTKEKMEFKENTLDLNFKETHKLIAILKDRKLLK